MESNNKHKYTKEEIEFLKDNHKEMTVKEICKALSIDNPASVRAKMFSLNLKCKRISVYSEDGTQKKCSKCNKYLPLEYFGNYKNKKRASCKVCDYGNTNFLNSSPRKFYTKEDEAFLKKEGHLYTCKELADMFNVTENSMRAKISALKCTYKKREVFLENGTKKHCSKCNEIFPVEEFKAKNNPNSHYTRGKCRACSYEDIVEERKLKSSKPAQRPTFDELIARSRLGYRVCTKCQKRITEETCIISYSSSKSTWEITPKCKPCNNKITVERRLKRLTERGY